MQQAITSIYVDKVEVGSRYWWSWNYLHLIDWTLVLVMAWCHQAASHYLGQCWPRFMTPYGTRPQWVDINMPSYQHRNSYDKDGGSHDSCIIMGISILRKPDWYQALTSGCENQKCNIFIFFKNDNKVFFKIQLTAHNESVISLLWLHPF